MYYLIEWDNVGENVDKYLCLIMIYLKIFFGVVLRNNVDVWWVYIGVNKLV